MRAAGLDQQDLVLAEMLMPWDDAADGNLLCARKHLLGAAIFAINLNRERPGRHGSLPGSSNVMFSFVFLDESAALPCYQRPTEDVHRSARYRTHQRGWLLCLASGSQIAWSASLLLTGPLQPAFRWFSVSA